MKKRGLITFPFHIATLGLSINVCNLCVHVKVRVCPYVLKYNVHVFARESQCLLYLIDFPLKTCTIDTFHTDLISLLNSYYIDFKSLNQIVSHRHE